MRIPFQNQCNGNGAFYLAAAKVIARLVIACMLALGTSNSSTQAQTDATWTGSAGGTSYSEPGNWDIGIVPVNDGGTTYNVTIPNGESVLFDLDDVSDITDLTLGAGSTLTIAPGEQLNVLDDARISGTITTIAGTFAAAGLASPQFQDGLGQLHVLGGGEISVAAPTYSSTGLALYRKGPTTFELFASDGLNSVLDLSSVQSIDAGFSDGDHQYGTYYTYQKITASNQGSIDLSSVQTITGPAHSSDRLDVIIDSSGGSIDLSSLTTVNSAGSGTTRFDLNTAGISLGSLNNVTRAAFEVEQGLTLDLPSLASADRVNFDLSQNVTLNVPALVTQSNSTITIAPGVEVFADALENLTSSTVNLSDGGAIHAPKLTDFSGSSISLTPLRTFEVDATSGLTNIDNARIAISGGTQFGAAYGDLSALSYSSAGLATYRQGPKTYELFAADGLNSVLDLSSVQSIDAGFSDGDYQYGTYYTNQRITASNQGSIDLSNVQTITGPAHSSDWLDVIIGSSGGSIDLSSLTTVNSAGSGTTRFDLNTAGISLGSLSNATRVVFEVEQGLTLDLPSLTSADRVNFDLSENVTLNVPALVTQSNSTITIAPGTEVFADALESLTSSTVNLSDNGAIHAPKLTDFSGSSISLTPLRTFEVDATSGLTNIDNARIAISGGTQFGTGYGDLSASSYSSTGLATYRQGPKTYDLFSADGLNSVLDLSSLQSIDAGFSDGDYQYGTYYTYQKITASNQGSIDLSSVQMITGPAHSSDRLDVIIDSSGGSLDLSALTTVNSAGSGYTRFDLNTAGISLGSLNNATRAVFEVEQGLTLDLPLLASAEYVNFDLSENVTLNVPSLVTQSNSSITIGLGAEVFAGALERLTSSTVSLSDNTAIHAPKLTDFSGSSIGLTPLRTLDVDATSGLTNIDNARIAVSDGAQFGTAYGDVSALSYSSTGLALYRQSPRTYELFSSDGVNSVLDLSSLQSIDAGFTDGDYTYGTYQTHHTITASNQGSIDLSNVQTITGPVHGSDRLQITLDTDSSIDLSSLRSVGPNVRFDIGTGGSLILGDLGVSNGTTISVNDLTSSLEVTGTLYLDPTSQLLVAPGAEVSVKGGFWFTYTDENRLDMDEATLRFDGTGIQFLEVGGEDLGLVDLPAEGNFGIGRLVIGQEGQPTTVMALDLFDNGHRVDGQNEAMYLYGVGGMDGLELSGGSTLVLDSINVYAMQSGEWIHLNALFDPGMTEVSFGGGIIVVPEPSSLILLGLCAVILLGSFLRHRIGVRVTDDRGRTSGDRKGQPRVGRSHAVTATAPSSDIV